MNESKVYTLREFTVPIPLYCQHCDKRFPKSSEVELQKPYVVIRCPKCGCMTPFKLEAAA
jgi:RNase P subunit RPR2